MPGEFRARHGIAMEEAVFGFLDPEAARVLLEVLREAPGSSASPRLKADRRNTVRGLLLGPDGLLHDAALLLGFEEVLAGLAQIGRVPPPLPLALARSRWRLPRGLRATLSRHRGATLSAPPGALEPVLCHLETCAGLVLSLAELQEGGGNVDRLGTLARELETLLFDAMQRRPQVLANHAAQVEDARVLVATFDPVHDARRTFAARLETALALGELAVHGATGELHALAVTWRGTLSDLLTSAVEDAT